MAEAWVHTFPALKLGSKFKLLKGHSRKVQRICSLIWLSLELSDFPPINCDSLSVYPPIGKAFLNRAPYNSTNSGVSLLSLVRGNLFFWWKPFEVLKGVSQQMKLSAGSYFYP